MKYLPAVLPDRPRLTLPPDAPTPPPGCGILIIAALIWAGIFAISYLIF